MGQTLITQLLKALRCSMSGAQRLIEVNQLLTIEIGDD